MDLVKIVIAGHVDHGKSTLVGKILNDSASILEDRYKKIEAICNSKAMKFEYAFLLDAFEEEQKQGITIDKLEIPWHFENKNFVFIDTPGHKEFINNMVSGSSNANLALILIDANEGIQEQTKQHLAVLNLFGLKNLIIVVNKMDLIDYDQNLFSSIKNEVNLILRKFHFQKVSILPVAAYFGENIFERSQKMPWCNDPALIEQILHFSSEKPQMLKKRNRLSIQDIYKFDDKRIYAGLVISGELTGDKMLNFIHSQSESTIRSFEDWNTTIPRSHYLEGDVVSFTIKDSLFLPIGEIACFDSPLPQKRKDICLSSFWFSKILPKINDTYLLKIGNQKQYVELVDFHKAENQIYDLKFIANSPLVFDFFEECPELGRAILIKESQVVAAGVIKQEKNLHHYDQIIKNERKPIIIWMTGLSGAGKSTLAIELKNRFPKMIILDGDDLRQGINSDLGFSNQDRNEQARRTAELAKLLAKQGHSVIVSLISPLSESRQLAREILSDFQFIEAFIKVPIEVCAERDSKGLYRLANDGKITQFTGIGLDYEAPLAPEMIIDNHLRTISENAQIIEQFIVGLKNQIP